MAADPDRALLVSDVHLAPDDPGITGLFFSFLEGPAREAGRLHLLGDIFDLWIGDDDRTPLAEGFAARARALADGGTRVFFTAGNHDFLVGEDMVARCGMALLPDEAPLRLHGRDLLLLHGDTLCTDDLAYMEWRGRCREPGNIRGFLAMPLEERRATVARMLSGGGQGAPVRPEVNGRAAADALERHRCTAMVHGHTHAAGVHRLEVGGREHLRYVLPPWSRGRAGYLRIDAEGIAFRRWNA